MNQSPMFSLGPNALDPSRQMLVPLAGLMMRAEGMKSILKKAAPGETLRIFVETGTADATTACGMLNRFEVVHSIELSEPLYKNALRNFGGTRINFHHGDSAEVLPRLIREELPPDEPVVFYLDAHWCDAYDGRAAQGQFPLWTELNAIRDLREPEDIVIIDDVHAFGAERDDAPWWAEVTPKRIVAELCPADCGTRVWQYNDELVLRPLKEKVPA